MNPVEQALALAAEGFAIVEVYPPTPDGGCTCREGAGCGSPGKHGVGHWSRDATRNPRRVRLLEYRRQGGIQSNYGVLPQRDSRLLIIDNDVAEVRGQLPIPETLTVTRPSAPVGKGHWYLRLPEYTEEAGVPRAYAGGEIRIASSGFVVGPGSKHFSGDSLESNGLPIALATTELVEALRSLPPQRDGLVAGEGRHWTLVQEARKQRGWGKDLDDLLEALLEVNEGFAEPKGADEVAAIAAWAVEHVDVDQLIYITRTHRPWEVVVRRG